MKKLGIAVLIIAIIGGIGLVSTTSAVNTSNIDWEKYFPNDEIFNGGAFVNDTVENNVTDENEEPEKNWEIIDGRIFPPGWANETRSGNFPPGWFNETPREEYNLKPDGWFEVNTRLY
jgi:hypothetical protein